MKKYQSSIPFIVTLLISYCLFAARTITRFLCDLPILRNVAECHFYQTPKKLPGETITLNPHWDYGHPLFSLLSFLALLLLIATTITLLVYFYQIIRHEKTRFRTISFLIFGLFILLIFAIILAIGVQGLIL